MAKIPTKPLVQTAVLLAIALVIGTIEHLIPPLIPALPNARIGLSNAVVLFATVALSRRSGLAIALLKSIIVPIFLGNPMMIAYSVVGSLCAYLATILLLWLRFSLISASLFAAIMHIVGQLAVAAAITATPAVFNLLPLLALVSAIAGIFVGALVYLIIKSPFLKPPPSQGYKNN